MLERKYFIAELAIQLTAISSILFFCLFLFFLLKKKKRILTIISALFLLGSLVVSYAYYIEPKQLHGKQQDIYLSDNKDEFVKIALVSDLHRGQFKKEIAIDRIIQELKKKNPDVIFILGDYLGEISAVAKDLEAFQSLNAPIYSIFGNHDVRVHPLTTKKLEEHVQENHITLLRNDSILIQMKGKSFELIGFEDLRHQGPKGIDFDLLAVEKSHPRLVLAHNPNTILFLEEYHQFDAMFFGHTHGKQVNIGLPVFDSVTRKKPPLVEGYKKENERHYYVSAGIGTSGLPIRFLVPPRIDMIHLYH